VKKVVPAAATNGNVSGETVLPFMLSPPSQSSPASTSTSTSKYKSTSTTITMKTPDDVATFVKTFRSQIDDAVSEHGAVVFRGFPLESPQDFNTFVESFDGFQDLSYDKSMSFAVRKRFGDASSSSPSSSSSSSPSSSPPSSPSPQRKPPIQTISKLSPTTSRHQFGNNQSILRSGRYNSTTDDGNKTALLGLIDSIEQKYNNNNNNDPSSPIQKYRTKQPKKSKSWAGRNTDTVERGRNDQQHDGRDGRSRSRSSKRARSASRSRKSRSKSRSKSKTRSRSKSASRKKKGEPATDDKRTNSSTNNTNNNMNPKYRRSRSLPPGPVEAVQDELPRAASFHQPRYPPPSSSSSIVPRNSSGGSYISDTRSVGADGSSSYYDGYDDSTAGSFHQHRRLHPTKWRLPLSSSPSERLQSYKNATWMTMVCLLIVGSVILILWIVGVIEI